MTRIESPIYDFMVIFNYLLHQTHQNHDCLIAPITVVKIIFILITKTNDNNSISTANYINTTININNE